MKKRIFMIKILRYICIILLLLTFLVIEIKKWHSFAWISVKPLNLRGRHSLAISNVPLFYFMQIASPNT